ncbi:MAG: type VI secretion system tip protein VgrG [Nannocystis sp.]|nr:type VI secretion system tip protein VgrG [Nannocystis sp.]
MSLLDQLKNKALAGNEALFSLEVDGAPELTRVVRFSGHESMSGLFEFQIEAAGPEMDLRSIVGKKARLMIDGIDAPRYVHGIVAQVEYSGATSRYTLYELVLVPALWRLQHRVSSRVFQHQTTEQVVTDVLKKAGLKKAEAKDEKKAGGGGDFSFSLGSKYEPRNYCIQYNESDLSFISRLLEEDGIFSYVRSSEGAGLLVFGDQADAYTVIPGAPVLLYNDQSAVRGQEHVTSVRLSEEVRPGKISLRDFNFRKPDQDMEVHADAENDVDLEIYAYPGEYQEPTEGAVHEGKSMAKIRLEALQAEKRRISGTSDCMRLIPGHTFALAMHPRADANGEYLVLRVVHHGTQPQVLDEEGQGAFHYGNEFLAIPKGTPYRPPRRTKRPVVSGIQSATVVGAGSEEVHTDQEGRVMVQFHWDRDGKKDEKSSCWVRVSQGWAGNGWGTMFLPRVGHEVLVDFIAGDPDRPIITGRVYHGKNELPYPLPDEKTKSTIKSNSSLGGGGFNELRFEDKKGAEEVFLHAQKDWNTTILNNHTESVGANRSSTIGANETITVGASRTSTISAAETITVGAARTVSVATTDATTVGVEHTVTMGPPPPPPAPENMCVAPAPPGAPAKMTMRSCLFIELTTGLATVTLDQGNISLKADGDISIEAAGAVRISGATVDVVGAGDVKINGKMIKLNC